MLPERWLRCSSDRSFDLFVHWFGVFKTAPLSSRSALNNRAFLKTLGHDPHAVIQHEGMADNPGGRIRAKELGTVGNFVGGDQAPRRSATEGLSDARFSIWYRFPCVGEHGAGG